MENVGNWIQFSEDVHGISRNGQFGLSLSFDDHRRIATGEPGFSTNSVQSACRVTVYDMKESTNTVLQKGRSLTGTINYERFGYSVELSLAGDRLAVGAIDNSWRVDIFELATIR